MLLGCGHKELAVPALRPPGCVIYSLEFDKDFNRTQTADDVVVVSDRVLHFKSPRGIEFIKQWQRMESKVSQEFISSSPDCRVVIDFGAERYAFDSRGEFGTINGKGVKYHEAVRSWFATYLLPFVK